MTVHKAHKTIEQANIDRRSVKFWDEEDNFDNQAALLINKRSRLEDLEATQYYGDLEEDLNKLDNKITRFRRHRYLSSACYYRSDADANIKRINSSFALLGKLQLSKNEIQFIRTKTVVWATA